MKPPLDREMTFLINEGCGLAERCPLERSMSVGRFLAARGLRLEHYTVRLRRCDAQGEGRAMTPTADTPLFLQDLLVCVPWSAEGA